MPCKIESIRNTVPSTASEKIRYDDRNSVCSPSILTDLLVISCSSNILTLRNNLLILLCMLCTFRY